MMVAAAGQGVLFSLALTGAVRIVCLLFGTTLPESVAGNLFMISSILTGATLRLSVRPIPETRQTKGRRWGSARRSELICNVTVAGISVAGITVAGIQNWRRGAA